MMGDALRLADCRLDEVGLRDQLQRYRLLGAGVRIAERRPGQLRVEFGPDVDRGLLDETLAIERRCCGFFRLDYSDEHRELTIGVDDPGHEPALDALHVALCPADTHQAGGIPAKA